MTSTNPKPAALPLSEAEELEMRDRDIYGWPDSDMQRLFATLDATRAQLTAATERAERAEASAEILRRENSMLVEGLFNSDAKRDAAQRTEARLRQAAENYRQSTADGYGHTQSATYYGKELDVALSSSSEPRKGGET